MNKIADTRWAETDSAENILTKSGLTGYGDGDRLDMGSQEQTFTKVDFEHDLRKASRKIKK